MLIVGIDPGTKKSGTAAIDFDLAYGECQTCRVVWSQESDNEYVVKHLGILKDGFGADDLVAIEHIISRKWSGRETSDAAIWSGIFAGQCFDRARFVTRARVRWELSGRRTGGDKEINAALKVYDSRLPGLSNSIKSMNPGPHEMAAIAVAATAFISPENAIKWGVK